MKCTAIQARVALLPTGRRRDRRYSYDEFALQGFSAYLTPEVVAAVRCAASIQSVTHNGPVSIDG